MSGDRPGTDARRRADAGTVARIDVDYGDQGFGGEVAIRVSNASFTGWTAANGATADDDQVRNIRPLVVLDPAEFHVTRDPHLAVKLLRSVALSHGDSDAAVLIRRIADQIDAQARCLKPEEPTSLGAVVRGRDGREFVRVCSRHPGEDGYDWRADGALGSDSSNRAWRQIDAVEVLSKGYQHSWYDDGGRLSHRGTTS